MKRLVWLVLFTFCAALGQAQAVDALAKSKHCACCHPGTCDMPGCCPAPAASALTFEAESSCGLATEAAAPLPKLAAKLGVGFYLSLVAQDTPASELPAPVVRLTPPANVPLFRAHCSLLI